MSAIEMHESLDRQLSEIRAAHAAEVQGLKDRLLIAEAEAIFHKDRCEAALVERDRYMRIATSLTTEFATVALVFERARKTAVASGFLEVKTAPPEGQPSEQDDTAASREQEPVEASSRGPQWSGTPAQEALRQASAAA